MSLPTGPSTGTAQGAPDVAWYALSPDEAASRLKVDPATGLTTAEVDARRATYGPNTFAQAKKVSRWQAFSSQYADPMQIVLLVAGVVCLFLPGQFYTGIFLILLTLFNAWMAMNQEGKAEASASALQGMMVVKVKARRNGDLVEIPMEELVPGDIVNIEAGDLVPADSRILTAATLEIDESALTGESVPTPKQVETVAAGAALGDRVDMAFMNCQVTRGAGTILVTTTGMATEVGHISGMLQSTEVEKTPLTKQLDALTNQILVIAGAALVVSIALGLYRGVQAQELFLSAVAFAVAAIPTALPAVVTAILSKGSQTLAGAGAIMKRLRSVETLGSTSALNSDKTGTLTLNQMTAVQMAVVGRRYSISGDGYSTTGQISHAGGQPDVPLEQYLLPMALCADAEVRDGALVGDPTEGALVVLAAKGGVDPALTRERYPRVATLPFDAAYKMMATFHAMKDDAGRDVIRGYIKGAPDQLLARAVNAHGPDGVVVPLADLREGYLAENQRLGTQGLRVMATGQKDFDPATFDPDADLLPAIDGLTLLAMVGIVDPPRPAAKNAIAEAKAAGIQVRMITGDHAVTAGAIAHQLGHRGSRHHRRRVPRDERRRGDAPDRRDRRHRPRLPGGQGPPRGHPQEEGPCRRDDRRRRERRPGPQEGGYRHRDGDHRDGGQQAGRRHDPHGRQLRDHREGGRPRASRVRQHDAVHPLPDGGPVRLHRDIPRLLAAQHPGRDPVPAAPDDVAQLHGQRLPGDRPRLRQAA